MSDSKPSPPPPSPNAIEVKFNKPNFDPYFQKLFLPFLSVLTLIAGLGASLVLTRQKQSPDIKASGGVALALIPSSSRVSLGEQFTVQVLLDTKKSQATTAQLEIKFSPEQLTVEAITDSDLAPGSISTEKAYINVGTETIPKQGSGIIATLTFRAKQAGTATISFSDATQVIGPTATNLVETQSPTQVTVVP